MEKTTLFNDWKTALMVLLFLSLSACAARKQPIGSGFNVRQIDTLLQKGVSTKTDVRKLIGEPNGSGSAIIPTCKDRFEIWFYGHNEIIDVLREGPNEIRVEALQKNLLIFFKKGVYDGLFWFSNAQKVQVHQ